MRAFAKIAAFICLLFLTHFANSQTKYEYGKLVKKFITTSHCPFDSSAGAFYILDHGYTGVNVSNWEIELTVHVVLKILSKTEFGQADISIPYFVRDRVSEFKASTYNLEGGKIIEDKLSRKDALIEKVDEDSREFNFTFPNVREGSVLEYQYTVESGDWLRLNTWYFQSSIPVLRSHYELSVPQYLTYDRLMTGYIPLTRSSVTQGQGLTRYYSYSTQEHDYLIENVPAFKSEDFMGTYQDNISKIDFELRSREVPGDQVYTFLSESYLDLAKTLAKDKEFVMNRENTGFAAEKTFSFIDGSTDQLSICRSLYSYVRDEFEVFYSEEDLSLKEVFKMKKGNPSEINKVLAAMLAQAGIEVNLTLLSTRGNGKLYEGYPIYRRLNHTIVRAKVGDETFLLDASDKKIPFGVLPKNCLNGKGLVIDETPEWVELKPFKTNKTVYGGQFFVDSDAVIKGDLVVRRYGYNAWSFLNEVNKSGEAQYIEEYNNKMSAWNIAKHEVGNIEKEHIVNQKLELEIEDNTDDLGDYVYLNPLLIAPVEDNPFKSKERVYPVDFGVHFTNVHNFKFTLDESFVVEELPKSERIVLPNKAGTLLYNVSVLGNEITVTSTYKINKSEFFAPEYPHLREFYALLVEKHAGQIVLRRI